MEKSKEELPGNGAEENKTVEDKVGKAYGEGENKAAKQGTRILEVQERVIGAGENLFLGGIPAEGNDEEQLSKQHHHRT